MTGSSVNTQAQAAEQQNQNTAQQYAAQQQQAAIKALNQYIQQNPSPASTAKPIAAPTASSPATMGGGSFTGGSGTMTPPAQAPQGGTQMTPQLQALVAQLTAQTAPKKVG